MNERDAILGQMESARANKKALLDDRADLETHIAAMEAELDAINDGIAAEDRELTALQAELEEIDAAVADEEDAWEGLS